MNQFTFSRSIGVSIAAAAVLGAFLREGAAAATV